MIPDRTGQIWQDEDAVFVVVGSPRAPTSDQDRGVFLHPVVVLESQYYGLWMVENWGETPWQAWEKSKFRRIA